MSQVYLPSDLPGLTFQIDRQPGFNTAVSTLAGREVRNTVQTNPRHKWRLSWDYILRPVVAGLPVPGPNELASFVFARRVDWDFFYYRDPDDCQATAQIFGIGDGSTKIFQLARSVSGVFTAPESIFAVGGQLSFLWLNAPPQPPAIESSNPTVSVNGSPVTLAGFGATPSSSQFAIDSTGNVHFGTAPAANATLTWSGFYYFRCHFVNNSASFAEFMHNFWDARELEFETTRYAN